MSNFAIVDADNGDEPGLALFADLDYATECTHELHAALQAAGYACDPIVDPAVLKAEQLGGRVEQHLTGGGIAVVHVLSHGDHTPDGGVYVVGSDAQRSQRTRVEAAR